MPALRNVPRLDRYVYNIGNGWDGQGNPRQQATLQLDSVDGGVRSNRIILRTEDGHSSTTNPGETPYDKVNEQPLTVTNTTTTLEDALLYDVSRFTPASSGARSSRSHSRRKDPYHIPRPRNAFIFFRSAYAEAQRGLGCSGQQNELSKDAARAWARMSDDQKQEYRDRALAEKLLHKKLFPHYVYSPGGKNSSGKLKTSATAGNDAGKNVTSSLAAAGKKKAQFSSDRSSSPDSPCSDASFIGTLMVPEIQASASMSAESSDSETGEALSPPAYAGKVQDKKEDFLPTANIPALGLSSANGPLLVGDEQSPGPNQGFFTPAAPLGPIPLDSFGFGPGYGFQSYIDPAALCEPLPHLPLPVDQWTVDVGMYNANYHGVAPATLTTTPAPHLPHPSEFSAPSDHFDFQMDPSSSFPAAAVSYSLGLEPDSDSINSSFENLNLNYDYGLDSDLTEADLQRMEVEVFDYSSFFPSGANGKGKERVE